MNIHVHHDFTDQHLVVRKLDQILELLKTIQKGEVIIVGNLEDLKANVEALTADVTAENTVIDSAITLIQGITTQMAVLSQQLADAIAQGDPAAIKAASDAIAAQNQLIIDKTATLAAAIPVNTPVL